MTWHGWNWRWYVQPVFGWIQGGGIGYVWQNSARLGRHTASNNCVCMPKMLQQFFWLLWLQPNTKQITILYAAASSPEVKVSESKVRLQMVNVKYNYFRLHALCLTSANPSLRMRDITWHVLLCQIWVHILIPRPHIAYLLWHFYWAPMKNKGCLLLRPPMCDSWSVGLFDVRVSWIVAVIFWLFPQPIFTQNGSNDVDSRTHVTFGVKIATF